MPPARRKKEPSIPFTGAASLNDADAPSDPDGDASPARPFEALLADATEAAARLESGELPLEDALDVYTRGMAALRGCEGKLRAVEARARVLLADDAGGWRLDPLDGGDDDDNADDDDATPDDDLAADGGY